jgi:drug/metabolite transporter (DMT)-like permease
MPPTSSVCSQPSLNRTAAGENRLLIFLAFACIYVIWGFTYLAIRYAVETIPPLFVAGFRHLIAGALLFGWCWWRGFRPIKQQRNWPQEYLRASERDSK